MTEFEQIQELLSRRADLKTRLKLLPYDGSAEIKTKGGRKYLYVRKRELGRLSSVYVGEYSDELYGLLLKYAAQAREIKKQLRHVEKQLAAIGYTIDGLSERVRLNVDFARINMKVNIYDQAVLEGVGTTFPQTEEIIEGGAVTGMTATDVQKILNLKHAWEFILDEGVIASKTDFYLLCRIAQIVNEGFFINGGRLRGVPVSIGGTNYIPPLPIEADVKENIAQIVAGDDDDVTKAIKLCMYCMRTQIFLDGNKRAAVIFANHYLISHGGGFIVIPEKRVPEFKKLLVEYYETDDISPVMSFIKQNCHKTF